MSDLPVVCIFGKENIELKSSGPAPDFETRKLDCRCYLTDENLSLILARDRPVAIVSFGAVEDFPYLWEAPFYIRRMWLNFEDTRELDEKGAKTFYCFLYNALMRRKDLPLVTVFTPTYNTGIKIMRPFHSLLAQTYKEWEWVVVDDSDDDGETFEMLAELAKRDFRIRVYRESRHSGVIGNVKRTACNLGRGDFLVELDHDDELLPNTLDWIVKGYQEHPEVGFIYTDFAECFEDGSPFTYGEGWGFGYGSYREEEHNGVTCMVVNSPHINAKTIRHIVAAPNHLRSWRKTVYDAIGGHNDLLHVADDYEIILRTFLATRMGHIPKMCYAQYRTESPNTHQVRNHEIQRMVRYISQWYDEKIHERLWELGVDDFVWKEGEDTFNRLHSVPNPELESHCTVTIVET